MRRHGAADAADRSEALYGTVLMLGVVLATSIGKEPGAREVLLAVVGTALVFWAVHMYAETLAERVGNPGRAHRELLRHAASRTWPLVEAAVPFAVVLALGAVGIFSDNTAVNLAVAVGLVDLFAWGVLVGRALKLSGPLVALTGLVNVGLGALMVLLKSLLH